MCLVVRPRGEERVWKAMEWQGRAVEGSRVHDICCTICVLRVGVLYGTGSLCISSM
jgi:hypothetical protein